MSEVAGLPGVEGTYLTRLSSEDKAFQRVSHRPAMDLHAHGCTGGGPGADRSWRTRMIGGEPVPTQDFAARLAKEGFVGLIVRSFANGAPDDALNLVLWRWNMGANARLEVVDDERRLERS